MTNEPATRPSEGQSKEVFWTRPQGALSGLSTDTKPTTTGDGTGAPLPAGTRFRERDTRLEYEWTGAAWVPVTAPDASAAAAAAQLQDQAPYVGQLVLTSALLRELRAIRTLLAGAQGLPAIFEPLPAILSDSIVY